MFIQDFNNMHLVPLPSPLVCVILYVFLPHDGSWIDFKSI